jgi:hypothetical protein
VLNKCKQTAESVTPMPRDLRKFVFRSNHGFLVIRSNKKFKSAEQNIHFYLPHMEYEGIGGSIGSCREKKLLQK